MASSRSEAKTDDPHGVEALKSPGVASIEKSWLGAEERWCFCRDARSELSPVPVTDVELGAEYVARLKSSEDVKRPRWIDSTECSGSSLGACILCDIDLEGERSGLDQMRPEGRHTSFVICAVELGGDAILTPATENIFHGVVLYLPQCQWFDIHRSGVSDTRVPLCFKIDQALISDYILLR
jgi:hypothetical protein